MSAFELWARGYGVIRHAPETCARIRTLASDLTASGRAHVEDEVYRVLAAADRLTSAAVWLIVHMTYAERVDLEGRALPAEAFKVNPEGHTGGALNVARAYVGYLAANHFTAQTRGWILRALCRRH